MPNPVSLSIVEEELVTRVNDFLKKMIGFSTIVVLRAKVLGRIQ